MAPITMDPDVLADAATKYEEAMSIADAAISALGAELD